MTDFEFVTSSLALLRLYFSVENETIYITTSKDVRFLELKYYRV